MPRGDGDAIKAGSKSESIVGKVVARVPLNKGRDLGEVTFSADPDTGGVAVHAINRTQRQIDRLFHDGAIDGPQFEAARALFELFAKARLVGDARAGKLETPASGRSSAYREPDVDDNAWSAYRLVLRQAGPDCRPALEAIVCHDQDPETFGQRHRCHGLTALRRSLDKLEKVFDQIGYRGVG